jgi:hypothetical protein
VNAVASIYSVLVLLVLFGLVLDIVGTDFLTIVRIVGLFFVNAEVAVLVVVVAALVVVLVFVELFMFFLIIHLPDD